MTGQTEHNDNRERAETAADQNAIRAKHKDTAQSGETKAEEKKKEAEKQKEHHPAHHNTHQHH